MGLDQRLRRRWFLTGVCGTVGRQLLDLVMQSEPQFVTCIDNNESGLFFLQDALRGDDRIEFFVCDLRDCDQLTARMAGAEIVLHAAAYKHVILCEHSPQAAIQTNIIGTQNVINAALTNGVERVLFTSSDKAVNPTNVMGTSKLMGERLITAANAYSRSANQLFTSTRFGNVLGSRGSVMPVFKRQIAQGGPVTLTDSRMTRFIMTMPEAAGLVMDSVFLARGGEVFVTKMPVVRIEDLAQVMIEEMAPLHGFRPADIPIEIIGGKPGEKLYEELMNEEEIRRTIELDRYFAITPAFRPIYRETDYEYPERVESRDVQHAYNSDRVEAMDRERLRSYLRTHGYIEREA